MMISQKQVLSGITEIRVSDTVQEFKKLQIFISASAIFYQSYGGSVRIYFRINYQHSFQILDKWLLLVKPNGKPASASCSRVSYL